MKMIFKIEEYLPETKQVMIRYCRQNAPKPISEYPAKAVSTEIYDVSFDSQNLVESIAQYGYKKVLRQENKEDILPVNLPHEIPNSVNLEDYVGKIIFVDGDSFTRKGSSRKLKRIEIE
tara:strand:+ start:226 stop:582 length:357 start_codon:yes stop_codon:yes gene_type:complete